MEPKQEIKLNKISDVVWEIPPTGKMNVPTRVFASEKLLNKMKQDRTLAQGSNVAALPGIYKYACIMPDGHEGYGFPIGGVAALDYKTGGISPGGIGYDINCLSKDSKILTEFGFFKKIQDFESDFIEVENPNSLYTLKTKMCQNSIISFDFHQKLFSSKNIQYFMKKKHFGSIIKIKTRAGRVLKVSEEHPILTKDGMIKAGNLKENQEVATQPFEGIKFEKIINNPTLIKDEAVFTPQEKRELQKRDLFPLALKNPKIPILTKLFGYLLGDGSIYFSGKKGFVNAYGSEEDLKLLQEDFNKLGFSAKIYGRERNHQITDQYGTKEFKTKNYELHASSNALAKLFFSLGYPPGKKTSTLYLIPDWIIDSPLWIKRLFLSSLFGAELSSPKTHTKTGFSCPIFSMNKNDDLIENCRFFCVQIIKMLEEFGVSVDKLHERKEHQNQFGPTSRVRIQISSQEENLLKLWSKIGFSYNKKREALSHMAILYIKEKNALTQKRREIAAKTKELKKKGLKLKEVQSLLECSLVNNRFIERHYYENTGQRISLDFISFNQFVKNKKQEVGEYGLLFDSIESITSEFYNDYVYDFNIPETHNFIANGVVVSNCGVRLLRTNLTKEQIYPKIKELLEELFKFVPAGLGSSNIRISKEELNKVLNQGSQWAVDNNYGTQEDMDYCEENGSMKTADQKAVSDSAKSRGMKQVATLGSGNHFLEIQYVDEIYDEKTAKAFGINKKDQVTVMIHCGSRGLGHQVCSDYLREMERTFPEIVKGLPDKELIYAPAGHPLAEKYLKAMSAAANFAWCNRHVIAHQVRLAFKKIFPDAELKTIYDVAHNICKIEEHLINGKPTKVFVHRKGATRAFGPGHKDLPKAYQKVGQPIILPGSMGTSSYLLVGTKEGMEATFGSTAHGAGRVMSRHEALNTFRGEKVKSDLEAQNIFVKGTGWKGIAEEAPGVYKDIDEVVEVSHQANIGRKVVRVRPIGVCKG